MKDAASVEVPESLVGDKSISRFLALALTDGQPRARTISFNLDALRRIEGDGVASFSNLLAWLESRGSVPKLMQLHEPLSDAVAYLRDSGFFATHSPDSRPPPQRRDTLLPLVRLRHEYTYDWLTTTLRPWLLDRLGIPDQAMDEIQTCLYEIFNNIKDHAGVDLGCCFAEWRPSITRLELTVADFGIGIPGSMREAFPGVADELAIAKAVDLGVTSKQAGQVPVATKAFFPGTLVQARFRTDVLTASVSQMDDSV